MNYKIQLISFIVSFLFGCIFYVLNYLNTKLIKKYNIFIKYLISFFFILDISILYILLMYKVNYGVIHIYFIAILFCGYILTSIYFKKLCKVFLNKLKH